MVANISNQTHPLPFQHLVGPRKKDALRLLTFIQESKAFTQLETGPLAYGRLSPPNPD